MCAATRALRRNPDTPDTIANNTSAIQNRNCHNAHNTDNRRCSQHWQLSQPGDNHDKRQHRHVCHNAHSAQLSQLCQLWKLTQPFQVWQPCKWSTSPQLQTSTRPTHSSSNIMTILYHDHHQLHHNWRRILSQLSQCYYVGIVTIDGGLVTMFTFITIMTIVASTT